ncbi:prepilin-type N-terminal cleavage/methylation domain-containing protein [Anaerorhabdus furcosa]|uniref:Prepilin-type N-terminal cleavage/methylation domain-containing protein n=1 Tax=Anaerorhabdus furcosa TaxID=118967 RepID=A0A1T4N770_9FIRM|nr:prepilin-type N-terminal cleavage/methylation domain-containing protein [Anaerorhabdus furcosa]SJZ74936.1 prepilin-type N-terminal cleavage/methylation domain-containing protein [Anaerorhabdus furcosa]
MNKVTKKGFTLIELIVVIAVLAVLGLLLVPQISGYIDASQATTCLNNRKLVERAITVAEAQSGKKQTFTKPEDVAAIPGSLYDGGKICPKDGTITIMDGKVNCSIHKESTGGGGSSFIKDGTILDQRENAVDYTNQARINFNDVIKQLQPDGTYRYVKCISSTGCAVDAFPSLPFSGPDAARFKEVSLEFYYWNNYNKGDIITYNGEYYMWNSNNSYPTSPNFKDPSKSNEFTKMVKDASGNWAPAN